MCDNTINIRLLCHNMIIDQMGIKIPFDRLLYCEYSSRICDPIKYGGCCIVDIYHKLLTKTVSNRCKN